MLQESQIQEEKKEQYEEEVEAASGVWVMSNISITKLLIRLDGN